MGDKGNRSIVVVNFEGIGDTAAQEGGLCYRALRDGRQNRAIRAPPSIGKGPFLDGAPERRGLDYLRSQGERS
jgi:hypothetical protein